MTTTALSKNYALGGWRIGAARFPDGDDGAALRERVRGIASELWSSTPMPMQHAAAYAWSDPEVLTDRLTASRRLHGSVARAVAGIFRSVGCDVLEPQGGFYVWPDFGPLAPVLRERWGIESSQDLAAVLLDEFGVGVLPGQAFGDACEPNQKRSGDACEPNQRRSGDACEPNQKRSSDEEGLRLRVAVPGIYGSTESERLAALVSDDPVAMPWIADALASLGGKLSALIGTSRP
ncbi:hypothetical protein GCM10029992_62160 [Glycomyces albus]